MHRIRRVCGIAALALTFSTLPALAVSHTWSGVTSGSWSDATNWSSGGAPANGETGVQLTFPEGTYHLNSLTNDVTLLEVTSLNFGYGAVLSGNAITLNGSVVSTSVTGGIWFWLPITLAGDSTFSSTGPGMRFGGVISGPYGLTVAGSLDLAAANTYTGVTNVLSGTLDVEDASGLGAGDGTPATGTVVSTGASIEPVGVWIANEALALGGTLRTQGFAFCRWSGPITLTSDAFVTVDGSIGQPLTIDGPISGAFGLTYYCGKPVTVWGSNGYTGTTTLTLGTLVINATEPNSAMFVSGGTLRGTGSVAGITAGGAFFTAVAPGTAAATGTLTAFGTVSFGANSTFQVRLNGPSVLTDYDQLFLPFGGPTLTGSTLGVTLGYAAAVGEQFTIINDGEGPPPTGIFNGLPEGATFVVGGETLQITYAGGPMSNNVVLTVTSTTPVELSRFAAE